MGEKEGGRRGKKRGGMVRRGERESQKERREENRREAESGRGERKKKSRVGRNKRVRKNVTKNIRGGNSFFFQAEDGIRDKHVTGVQTCALPISFSNHLKKYFFKKPNRVCKCLHTVSIS